MTPDLALPELAQKGVAVDQKFDVILTSVMLCDGCSGASCGRYCGGLPLGPESFGVLSSLLEPGGAMFHFMVGTANPQPRIKQALAHSRIAVEQDWVVGRKIIGAVVGEDIADKFSELMSSHEEVVEKETERIVASCTELNSAIVLSLHKGPAGPSMVVPPPSVEPAAPARIAEDKDLDDLRKALAFFAADLGTEMNKFDHEVVSAREPEQMVGREELQESRRKLLEQLAERQGWKSEAEDGTSPDAFLRQRSAKNRTELMGKVVERQQAIGHCIELPSVQKILACLEGEGAVGSVYPPGSVFSKIRVRTLDENPDVKQKYFGLLLHMFAGIDQFPNPFLPQFRGPCRLPRTMTQDALLRMPPTSCRERGDTPRGQFSGDILYGKGRSLFDAICANPDRVNHAFQALMEQLVRH